MRRAQALLGAALVVAFTALAGCGSDDPDDGATDTGADATSDTAVDTDSTADTSTDAGADTVEDIATAPPCGDDLCEDGEDEATCPDDCGEATVLFYEPASGDLGIFPDDYFTVEADTLTGLQVTLDAEAAPAIHEQSGGFATIFDDLSELDGWGTLAGGYARFAGPIDPATVPTGPATAEPDSPLFFGYFDDDGELIRVPVLGWLTDEDATIMMQPLVPLPPAVQGVLAVSADVTDVQGNALRSNHILRAALSGQSDDPRFDAIAARIADGVTSLIDAGFVSDADELAAFTVFTTQSVFEESIAIAEDIRGHEHSVLERTGCEERGTYLECGFTFEAGNYRDETGYVVQGGERQSTYVLPVSVYLPLPDSGFDAPYPAIVRGHGLVGDRFSGSKARVNCPAGMAIISIDAPEHGEHPIQASDNEVFTALDFFGFDPAGSLDAKLLRDNWRQAAYDKLSLLDLILSGLDVDGDGEVDLATDRLAYTGHSLGAIMGAGVRRPGARGRRRRAQTRAGGASPTSYVTASSSRPSSTCSAPPGSPTAISTGSGSHYRRRSSAATQATTRRISCGKTSSSVTRLTCSTS